MDSRKILYLVLIVVAVILTSAFFTGKKHTSTISKVDVDEVRKEILDEARDVRGTIKEVSSSVGSGTTMTIEVEVPDISRIDSRGEVPAILKTIEVFVDNGILIGGTRSPQAGDVAVVTLDKSVYDNTRFNATKIEVYNYASEMKKQAVAVQLIGGGITKSLSGSTFTMKAWIPDTERIDSIDFSKPFSVPQIERTYTITIASTTRYIGGTQNDLKLGTSVEVWGEDLLNRNAFTASKILIK